MTQHPSIFDVRNRIALVTGAASGIGLAIAEMLVQNGARVAMCDIDGEGVHKEAARLGADGGQAEAFELDIADFEAVRAVVDGWAAQNGRLDITFANAGTSAGPGFGSPQGQAEMVDMAVWERSLRVNLDGTFVTLQAAARHMKSQGSGSIVVTASISALKVSPLPAYAYHAAKAGIAQVVRVAAKELGACNVRVNAIAPGPFATNMANGRLRDPESAAKFAATVPLGRVAHPNEIKGLALLMASDASSFVNGAIIPIDGGDSA